MTDREIFERIFLKHNPTCSAEHSPFEPERYKYAFAQSNYEMFLEYKAAIIESQAINSEDDTCGGLYPPEEKRRRGEYWLNSLNSENQTDNTEAG